MVEQILIGQKTREEKTVDLEQILQLCGAKKPFDKEGKLTKAGEKAFERLLKIGQGLYDIGANDRLGHQLEAYLDEIIEMEQ